MEKLKPHQQRVIQESEELKTKADSLVNFISVNKNFELLPEDEKERLRKQAGLMFQYYEVLLERIEHFD